MKGVTSMKKIIFRRPFVTKKDRAIAKDLLLEAESLANAAEREISAHNGAIIPNATVFTVLIQTSYNYMNKAARRLGFRNIADMNRYLEVHGKV